MTKYEYHVLTVTSDGDVQSELNTLGTDGWQVVAVLPETTGRDAMVQRLVLQRKTK
jgi:hypothetical protein